MKKIKCDACGQYHGGFHLCPGRRITVEDRYAPKEILKPSETMKRLEQSAGKAAGAFARWDAHFAQNKERDEKVIATYDEGYSMKQTGKIHGLTYVQVRNIVRRLGQPRPPGTLRLKE